jgi:hypothetical protein
MARQVGGGKRRIWSQRLRRFSHSGTTVAAFCRGEGVSTAGFYRWRRLLAKPQARRQRQQRKICPDFAPVSLLSSPTVEILLPNGVRIRVPTGDLCSIETAIAAAARLPKNEE